MNPREIQVELQSLGVRVPENRNSRRGGAGPAEGQVMIFNDRSLSVPTQSSYVASSPYEIKANGHSLALYRYDVAIGTVTLPQRPKYYDLKTPGGTLFEKIALIHGKDCLAATVYQDCLYWNTDTGCAFCGIGLTLLSNNTILEKAPEELAIAAEQAKLWDGINHITLTTGMRISEQETISHLRRCIKALKNRTGLPVHVQICPPANMHYLEQLKNEGADTIGIHIETFDQSVLKRIAPAKAECGLDAFIKSWTYAVSLFGKNQVSSFIIAGLGEDRSSIIEGAELLCEIGVFPYLLPFRPIPSTPLAHSKPPAPETMMSLYERVGSLIKKHGLASHASKAGCVRCGACSSISLFE